jgi:hypothetical protein
MAYTVFPESREEVLRAITDQTLATEAADLFDACSVLGRTGTPIALDPDTPKKIKVARCLSLDFNKLRDSFSGSHLVLVLGDGSRGNKGKNSLGFWFEKQVSREFNSVLSGSTPSETPIGSAVAAVAASEGALESYGTALVSPHCTFRRTLCVSTGVLYVGDPLRGGQIGEVVSDVTVSHSCGTAFFVSAKWDNQVTAFNCGVTKFIRPVDVLSGKLPGEVGLALLGALGADWDYFRNQFIGRPADVSVEDPPADVASLESMVASGFGWGYHMLHGMKVGRVDWERFVKEFAASELRVEGITVRYPKSKRVSVVVRTKWARLDVNVRSKQGTWFPTHVMCDFYRGRNRR